VQESDLALWRAKALERMPYFAPILFSLRVLDAPALGTFAVDAWHRLYVDFDAVAGWSAMENAEALLHECGHLFRDHAARADTRGVEDHERTAWNIAADAMLNLDLVQAGCRTLGQKGIVPAKLGLPDGRTAEWYFDQLRPATPPNRGGRETDGKPYAGCGYGSGAGAAPAPGEIDGTGSGAAQGAGDVERELVRINTAAAIRQHAEQRGRGSVPGGLLQEAEQVLSPPKVPWQQVLAPAIRRAVASRAGHFDIDPSRRHRPAGRHQSSPRPEAAATRHRRVHRRRDTLARRQTLRAAGDLPSRGRCCRCGRTRARVGGECCCRERRLILAEVVASV